MKREDMGKYGLIGIFLVCSIGVGYGLHHDFTPEYEASVPIQYDMLVYDANGNETILSDLSHNKHLRNFRIEGNKVIALTPLSEEGLILQERDGCVACHPK